MNLMAKPKSKNKHGDGVIAVIDASGKGFCTKHDHADHLDSTDDKNTVLTDSDAWAADVGMCSRDGCDVLFSDETA